MAAERITQNPHLEIVPDHAGPHYDAIRTILINTSITNDCYGFEYSKENPKNINSHISSKPFWVPGFKDSESSLMKEFISRVEPMF